VGDGAEDDDPFGRGLGQEAGDAPQALRLILPLLALEVGAGEGDGGQGERALVQQPS
jgi:hypothetical protein